MNYTYKNHSKAFIFSVMMFVFSACFRYTDPHVPSISANIDYGVPPFIAWVLLFVIAVVLMLLLSEEYQFTMSGITVNRLFFKKHYALFVLINVPSTELLVSNLDSLRQSFSGNVVVAEAVHLYFFSV